jgi:hypothetical protein
MFAVPIVVRAGRIGEVEISGVNEFLDYVGSQSLCHLISAGVKVMANARPQLSVSRLRVPYHFRSNRSGTKFLERSNRSHARGDPILYASDRHLPGFDDAGNIRA